MAGPINPGRVVAHRLNKVEYDNTIRDLDRHRSQTVVVTLGFPDDNYVEGFDNNADALTRAATAAREAADGDRGDRARRCSTSRPATPRCGPRIMVCDPAKAGDAACATQILSTFATRAFRRPVAADEMLRLRGSSPTSRSSVGDGFEQGIAAGAAGDPAVAAIPVPRREEPGRRATYAPLDDYEVAVAAVVLPLEQHAGRPAVRASRAAARCTTARRSSTRSDACSPTRGPSALVAQPGRRVARQPRAGGPADDADRRELRRRASRRDGGRGLAVPGRDVPRAATRVKELLERRLPCSRTIASRRTTAWPAPARSAPAHADARRSPTPARSGGILTQANTLTVTSMRDRTSPTRRGKWISENLLCVVIPPPPPMIPQLVPIDQATPTSVRERLAAAPRARARPATAATSSSIRSASGWSTTTRSGAGATPTTAPRSTRPARCRITNAAFDGAVSLAGPRSANDQRFLDCIDRASS